jgi:hypothetical protein
VPNPNFIKPPNPHAHGGTLRVPNAAISGQIEEEIMIEEARRDCVESIVHDLTRTSEFRTRKFKQYPDDSRNLRAAESLILLAKNATELPDEYWERLQPLYDPDSKG